MSGPVAAALAPAGTAKKSAAVADLRLGEFVVLLPLLALIFYLGIFPGMVTLRLEKTVTALPTIQSAMHPAPQPSTLLEGKGSRALVVKFRYPSSLEAPGSTVTHRLRTDGTTGSISQHTGGISGSFAPRSGRGQGREDLI